MLLQGFFIACTGLTMCGATAIASSSSQALLPKQTGLYQVGRSATELIDHSRTQPFVPDVEPVRLMITVYYPVSPQNPPTTGAYMPPETARFEDIILSSYGLAAPNGTFEKLALRLASSEKVQNLTHQGLCHHPLVIFMPAESTTRLFYGQIASTIASNGYIVVSIDAPYDVDIVEYPDGSVVTINQTLWNNPNQTALEQTAYLAIESRVKDSGLNTTHTAMFGHSLGGATAFSILEADDRVKGGLNMDSGLYGPGLQKGTDKPFMLMGHTNHTRDNPETDPALTWATVWPNLRGWKRDVIVADTLHYSFSDYPIVFETLGITPGKKVGQGAIQVASMTGTRALNIVTSYACAFLDFVIYGKCSALLDGPVGEFPEVTFEY